MAQWTTEKREQYLKDHPENFAGPDGTFPIEDGKDVEDAWGLAGHADDPNAVRTKIRSIAERLNLTSSLPDTAKEDDNKERSMSPQDTLARAAATHDPMSGTHSHAHPAFGAQGDDDSHEHEHSHDNDNNHDHKHSEERALTASNRVSMYAPLTRIDNTKWEVLGQATAEVPDSYGTIFGYCPEAWQLWRRNIREQHDPKKAVGKGIDYFLHEDTRSVDLLSRVSRGAPDTWRKVEDDVLIGYSLSVIPDDEFGHDPKKWPQKEYQGKMYPYLPRYTIAEVSLVDNPACPNCNIAIVRADGFATEVLDTTEEEPQQTTSVPSSSLLDRAGARVSSGTRDAMHGGIGHTLRAAVSQMKNCGCESCQDAMKHIDPDGDGDIDLGGYDDSDQDWRSLYSSPAEATERSIATIVERVLVSQMQPIYARLQGIAGTLARSNASSHTLALDNDAITRAMESSLTTVRADLSAVRELVDQIANTPVPGAPIMNANALPLRPVEKRLPTDPQPDLYARPQRSGSAVADAMERMYRSGQISNFDEQMQALTAGLILQQQEKARRP